MEAPNPSLTAAEDAELTAAEDAELVKLVELGAELAAASASLWQPRCIARAFATHAQEWLFTFQVWIDLDATHSPLTFGQLPETAEQTQEALDAFCLPLVALDSDPAEIGGLMEELRATVTRSLRLALSMRPEENGEAVADEGFGTWLPVLSCLISQIGMSRTEALATPVAHGFALIAAFRRNQGWKIASGTPYALRDVELSAADAASAKHPEPAPAATSEEVS